MPDDNPVDALDIEEQGQQQQQVNDNLSEQVDDIDDATKNENLQPSSQPENSIDDVQETPFMMSLILEFGEILIIWVEIY